MNWYKKAKLKKSASMNIYVADYKYPKKKETLLDLSFYLTDYLFYKTNFYNNLTDFEKAHFQKNRAREFVIMDGKSNFDDPIGTLNVYLAGLPEKSYSAIIEGLNKVLTQEKFDFDISGIEQSKSFNSNVIRVNIKSNPYSGIDKDVPPEVNFSNTNARLLFEKILGYDMSDASVEMPVFDLINRINKVSAEQLEVNERPTTRDWNPGKVQMIEGGYSIDQIQRGLDRIKEVAQWALDHNYKRIYVA